MQETISKHTLRVIHVRCDLRVFCVDRAVLCGKGVDKAALLCGKGVSGVFIRSEIHPLGSVSPLPTLATPASAMHKLKRVGL